MLFDPASQAASRDDASYADHARTGFGGPAAASSAFEGALRQAPSEETPSCMTSPEKSGLSNFIDEKAVGIGLNNALSRVVPKLEALYPQGDFEVGSGEFAVVVGDDIPSGREDDPGWYDRTTDRLYLNGNVMVDEGPERFDLIVAHELLHRTSVRYSQEIIDAYGVGLTFPREVATPGGARGFSAHGVLLEGLTNHFAQEATGIVGGYTGETPVAGDLVRSVGQGTAEAAYFNADRQAIERLRRAFSDMAQ